VPDAPPPLSTRHGLDDLYDIARLADRLGVEHATIRVWLSRKVPWLPPPDGRLNGGAVWRAETLAGLEDRRHPGRPGPRPRAVAPVGPATGGIPVIPTTGAVSVLPVTGGAPGGNTLMGSVPTAHGSPAAGLSHVLAPACPTEGGD
jgi:hypothetical protein